MVSAHGLYGHAALVEEDLDQGHAPNPLRLMVGEIASSWAMTLRRKTAIPNLAQVWIITFSIFMYLIKYRYSTTHSLHRGTEEES